MNEIIAAIISRRSTKAFTDRPVEREKLEQILLAGTYAANGMGRQSAKLVMLTDKKEIAALEAMNAAILGNPAAHPFYGATAVCVVLAQADCFTAVEDGSLALGNMLLAAHSLGVGSCWIHRARETFSSPEGKALLKKWGVEGAYLGVGQCALGYAAKEPKPAAPRKADFITWVEETM